MRFVVGIPIGTWKITDLSTDERKLLCQQQQEFCTVSSIFRFVSIECVFNYYEEKKKKDRMRR